MSDTNISGVCESKFSEIGDIFEDAVESGFDT